MRILTASCKMASILFTLSLIPSSSGVFVEVIVCCKSIKDEVNSFGMITEIYRNSNFILIVLFLGKNTNYAIPYDLLRMIAKSYIYTDIRLLKS
ncbi:hypothetical protein BH18THE2_BH18THE2_34140 [soil metagenome]